MLLALFRGGAAVRIDRDELRAAPLGFLRLHPEMQVGGHGIAAPDDDELAVAVLLDVHADRGADHGGPARLAGRGADRAVEERGAQAMEEAPVHRGVLQQPHGAGVAVGEDRLRAVGAAGDRGEALGDDVERVVPGDALEAAFALGAHAAHGMEHALVGVGALEVARDLRAEHAAGGRMLGVTLDRDGPPVLYGRDERARVRTVVRTRALYEAAAGGCGVVGHEIIEGRFYRRIRVLPQGNIPCLSSSTHPPPDPARRDERPRARPRHLEHGRARPIRPRARWRRSKPVSRWASR